MPTAISIAMVERNHVLREGFRRVLSRAPLRISSLWSTIDEAADDREAVAAPPDVILVSIGRRHAPSPEDMERLRSAYPRAHLMIVVDATDHPALSGPLGAAVDGALLQSARPDAMIKSIELIMMGERFFPAPPRAHDPAHDDDDEIEHPCGAGSQLNGADALDDLSPREREVLAALRRGSPNKLIARDLSISDATVKVHVKSILRKTGARNRTEAALWAVGVGAGLEPARRRGSENGPDRGDGGRR